MIVIRISLNPVDRTNAAYHSRWPRSEVERYQALASRSSNGWSGSHHPWVSGDQTNSSNPTASASVDRCQIGPCKTSVFWRLARLEKRLELGCATRNATPQAPCTELHGRYRRSKELARNAKNPRKIRSPVAPFPCLPCDEVDATYYATIRHELELQG
jgi:hypothetical protein